VRDVDDDVIKAIAFGADIYVKRHRQYAKALQRIR
jgi:hypothetical protein